MQFLIQGDRGVWVEYLQLALTRAGYPARIDGIFGERTCQALKDFTGDTDNCTVNRVVWENLKPYLTGYRMHTIKKGDTVFGLARRYGTTEEAILTANPLIDPDELVIDAILAIPLGFPLVPQMVKYTSVLTRWIVEGLVVRYPFLSAGVIGKSVMGKDIWSIWIGTGAKQVFYSASYHANESITTPVLLAFAEEYAASYASGGNIVFSSAAGAENDGQTDMGQESVDARTLYNEFQLCMVPLVNPDGVDLVNGLLNSGVYYRRARLIAEDYPAIPYGGAARRARGNRAGCDARHSGPHPAAQGAHTGQPGAVGAPAHDDAGLFLRTGGGGLRHGAAPLRQELHGRHRARAARLQSGRGAVPRRRYGYAYDV